MMMSSAEEFRRKKAGIVEHLREHGRQKLYIISWEFGISADTIRRDAKKMGVKVIKEKYKRGKKDAFRYWVDIDEDAKPQTFSGVRLW